MKMTLALVLATALSQPVCAAEFLIHETESAIVVEYNGEPDGKSGNLNAAKNTTDHVANSTEAKPAQIAPVSPMNAAADDEEEVSERSKARSEAAAARAKIRTARIARNSKYEKGTSSIGDNAYLPIYPQEEE